MGGFNNLDKLLGLQLTKGLSLGLTQTIAETVILR